MTHYMKEYQFWLENDYFDDATKEELRAIQGNEEEIKERFHRKLQFGTSGLRGIIAAGTNRMNIYTVRKATQGFANFINKQGATSGVVIAHDTRRKSREFAENTARVFAANGIKVYLFDDYRPTPLCSFAIRQLKAAAGVVITASHNPKEYNGYKVFGDSGAAYEESNSQQITDEINALKDITDIRIIDQVGEADAGASDSSANMEWMKQQGLLHIIGKEIDDAFIVAVKQYAVEPELTKEKGGMLGIVYTPLHGTGNPFMRRIFAETGFSNVHVVKEQELPDPEFSTVKSPNPDNIETFALGIRDAKAMDADVIIGNDPDADRAAIVARDCKGEYRLLSGNLMGSVLLYYLCSRMKERGTLPANGFMVKTVVTTELCRAIAEHFGVEVKEVHTGFKYIGEQIALFDDTGKGKYIMGFEESFGYLVGTHVRDKDSVVSSMLIAEAALYYKMQGKTLWDVIDDMYQAFGFRKEDELSFLMEGIEGEKKIKYTMEQMKQLQADSVEGFPIVAIRDYSAAIRTCLVDGTKETLQLQKQNFVYFELEDHSWFAVRPSGTEPKLRVYFEYCGRTKEEAAQKLADMRSKVVAIVEGYLFG